jgi:hypothetical protein
MAHDSVSIYISNTYYFRLIKHLKQHLINFTSFEILGEFKSYPIGIVGNTIECKTILISSTNFYFRRSLFYNFDTEIKLSDTISSKFAADIHWGGFAFIKKNV